MLKHAALPLLAFSWLTLSACSGDDDTPAPSPDTPPKGKETRVIFNPGASDLPIPNDLMFEADGTLEAGEDPANPVITGIDALDGSSVAAPIDIEFSGRLYGGQELDAASFVVMGESVVPNPNQNVFLLPLTYPSGDPVQPAQLDIDQDGDTESIEVPTFAKAMAYQQAVAAGDSAALQRLAAPTARAEIISLDGGINNVVRISPLQPLMPQTKYLVVVTNDIEDDAGYPVYPSHSYTYVRDPESPFEGDDDTIVSLRDLRSAINSWERLATGYFGFMQSVFDAAGVNATAPSADDIVLTLTFTTGGTDGVLKSAAAPDVFFTQSLTREAKQDAITKLVSGFYNLSGDNSALTNPIDAGINSTLHMLLTAPTLPDESPNPLYRAEIAGAIAAGADYMTLGADASAAFIMQTAAAEAAVQVNNGDGQTLAAEAESLVMDAADGAADAFPTPAPRSTSFYRVDDASAINPALQAPAKVYQGQITLPYYHQRPSGGDGDAITGSRWIASDVAASRTPEDSDFVTYRNPFPAKQSDVTVPLLAVLPDAATVANFGITKPEAGWPVIIYVHGIRTDRSTALPIADAMAFACVAPDLSGPTGAPCFATLAIDQPLHGVAPAGSVVPGLNSVTDPDVAATPNVAAGSPSAELSERHFDFTADAQANPIPMDYSADMGSSGSLFINLTHFSNARGNMQQMVLDLLNLNASIAEMDIDGDGTANDIDPSRVYLIGHSLGAITGIPFVAINNDNSVQSSPFSDLPTIHAAALLNTGSAVPRLLVNSPSFAPTILQGLAAASDELTQGRSGLETYLNVFQGLLDTVDPINYAASLSDASSSTGILLTEVVGDGSAENPADRTIPNAADERWGENNGPLEMVLDSGFVIDSFPAPLAGTEPLIAQFEASPSRQVNGVDGDPAVLVTRFTEGSHSTPVVGGNNEADPFTSGAVFEELIRELTAFFSVNGNVTSSIVVNDEVVAD